MIKKLKSLEVDIKLIDGLVFLAVLVLLPLNLWFIDVNKFIELDVWAFVIFYVTQVVFALVLAIEFEEIYLNYKKAHSWVLAVVILFTLFALTYYIGAFGFVGTLILVAMIYILTHRFSVMKKRALVSKPKKTVAKTAAKKKSTIKKTVKKK